MSSPPPMTPADRIRRALGFCHRRFWSQKVKDAIKDAASALAELERERDIEAEKAEYEREKLKREAQEPVAFRWLGPGKGWRAVYAEPPVPHVDPDWLANVIRRSDPRMTMTSDELAEKIADAINGRAK